MISKSCQPEYLQFVSDDWPAQRIPFCMYTQKSLSDPSSLKKVTFNYDNWRIERPENAHFFWHFRDVCFEEAYLDVYNDRSLTLFLLDCPIFKLRTGHFTIRSTTEPLPFQRITEFARQKVVMPKCQVEEEISMELAKELLDPGNAMFEFILTGKVVCSELALEANEFQMLFDLIEEYKYAYSLCHAIPVVRLTVPPYVWHQRPFIEGTLCDSFHTSEKLSPLLHEFGFFDALSSLQKFTCIVHYKEMEEDKVQFYEFRVESI